MENTKNKATKLKLILHQPKKWDRQDWVTQEDYEDYESIIYNDLNLLEKIEKDIPQLDLGFLDTVLIEDEAYAKIPGDHDNYYITTYGRVFNIKNYKQLAPSFSKNAVSMMIKGDSIRYKRLFPNLGWIYSPSFIKQKYKENGWNYYTNKNYEF